MGFEISKGITNAVELFETVRKCLDRSEGWPEYHAARPAGLSESPPIDAAKLEQAEAEAERKSFELFRGGYYDKSISVTKKFLDKSPIEKLTKGWMLQLAARSANHWGRDDLLQELQKEAYANNTNVSRPKVAPPYVHLVPPGKQPEVIVD